MTFRLADSLPADVVARLGRLDPEDHAGRWRETEEALDHAAGTCILDRSECAEALISTMLRFDGERFVLHGWCVMPNHVHVLLHVLPGYALGDIVGGWKSVSARRIREIVPGDSGVLWQADWFDRFVRDEAHYRKTLAYIHDNPVKAGLVASAEAWPWSSASSGERRAGTPALRHEGGDALFSVRLRDRLLAPLAERAAKSTERVLAERPAAPDYENLADNDYLGLSRDPEVIDAAKAAAEEWGASSSASPLISGYTGEHAALERELADWCGFAHGLVWNTGFAANAAVLGALPKPGDLVLADRLIHASMISGILASGARLVRYPHLDLVRLRELLEKHRDHAGVVWVVTESVFSMDGDYPDLATLAALKREFGFVLVVDEAHATGWYGVSGEGLAGREGVAADIDILVGTLGKGLGGFGAYTLFHDDTFRRYLSNFAGEFVYSTYLPPACAAAGRAAIRRVKAIRGAGADFAALSRRWRSAIREVVPEAPEGDSPVIPIPIGDAARTMEVASALLDAGWRVGAVRPPTVPEGEARLRVSLRATGNDDAPARFAGALRKALGRPDY